MENLKENMEKSKSLYNILQENRSDDDLKIKDLLKKHYTEFTNSEDMVKLFSNHENYEVYKTDLFTYPIVCIFKTEILIEIYGDQFNIGYLNYFENEERTKILYPVIILSDEVLNTRNRTLINYVLAHELGHYRKNHVSSIYFNDNKRNILKEVEADLYACSILGIEGAINGLRELVIYLIDKFPKSDVDEVLKRLTFISRKYNVSGALDGFELIEKEDKE